MLLSVMYFIVTLLLLILVHESGHFLMARWCGVKVLRFSFGFGKVLAVWRDTRGTEYAWSLLPFGGYVKLLDENEGPVPSAESHKALNRQPMMVRIAIILAGPLFNFLFAFLLLWLVAVIGIQSFAPRIADVIPGSIAAHAQLGKSQEIIALDDKKIDNWRDVHYALMPFLGSSREIPITLKSLNDHTISTHQLALKDWILDSHHPELLESLGIVPLFPKMPLIIDNVVADSPAQLAGLQAGDEIVAVDKHLIADGLNIVEYVASRAGQTVSLDIVRQKKNLVLLAHLTQADNHKSGFLGIGARSPEIPPDWLRLERSGPIDAIAQAFRQTVSFTSMTCVMIGRTLMGHLSLDHVSGPVGIAKAAGASAHIGLVYYLFFIALLSISLGVLNLLPIPMLDGGHLMYNLIELIIRRPLSADFKAKGAFVGMGCIIVLTVIALVNDLT
ncbi:MAG: RIP metalloprotease RseP [Legionella sp.]|nr:MAG: RIP metalloprotease RseP [Legionella sp.]